MWSDPISASGYGGNSVYTVYESSVGKKIVSLFSYYVFWIISISKYTAYFNWTNNMFYLLLNGVLGGTQACPLFHCVLRRENLTKI